MARKNAIVTGSIAAISQQENVTLAESMLNCDVLLLVDMSSSMAAKDAPGGKSRYEAAENEVVRLQRDYPGKIGLIVFSNTTQFCPTGQPIRLGGGTNLSRALKFIKPVDDAGFQIIVISDGIPDNPRKCLEIARTFKNRIDTIFVGPETDLYGGRKFLEQLADATGGKAIKSAAPGLLASSVERLMLNG